ncbi:MAG TPA: excinuclease ABC subunit UvrA [Candidatus Paceibacterota bacterium]
MSKKVVKIEKQPVNKIVVKGARTHNLKNISVEMPRGKMIAITGRSGSGKSSLAFDTIFAEGQRRYVESLSAYARQFLEQMQRPDVDEISGLSPAISIDQKSRSNNPRSTVATITEIYDYLRVLYARVGKPYSPISGNEIRRMSNDEIVNSIIETIKKELGTKKGKEILGISLSDAQVAILAPVVRGRKGEYYQLLYDYLNRGYSFAYIDGEMKSLRERVELTKTKPHDIDIVSDIIDVNDLQGNEKEFLMRTREALERAIQETEGLVKVIIGKLDGTDDQKRETTFSAKLVCPEDGFSFPEIEPRLFSFNSPYGACPECHGLGKKALFGNEHDEDCKVCKGARLRQEALFVMMGDHAQYIKLQKSLSEFEQFPPEDATNWKKPGINIFDFTNLSVEDAHDFVLNLELSPKDREIADPLLNEIESRLQFLLDVGLEYLTLNRRANTLSGGEAQRIRLASQLGSKLVGALYVLDEPTIGLHQRDNAKLIKTLTDLRDLGNTIIVVEHDEDTVFASDYIIDIGPGAGVHGGNVIAMGDLQPLLEAKTNHTKSLTLAYLRGEETIDVPDKRRTTDKGVISIKGARLHNIKGLSVDIPLGRLVTITGVSGSGKSTFLYEILHRNLLNRYDRKYRSIKPVHCEQFVGDNGISRVVMVDQSQIGRTPRSNPATYTGAWTFVRDLYSNTEEAKIRGWKPNRFSFNVKGGRCETCEGRGEIAVEMHFLPTVYVQCDICGGKRFDKETLKVKYKGKNVHDILEMTIEEAYEFFKDIPAIADRMRTLVDVGLSYIKLGQTANTLSGGESQRVKIASELYLPMTQKSIYLLDEPTVGLHFDDVKTLIGILNRLVDRGNSVILIEHNLDMVKCSDYLIDFGPEGGVGGGHIIAKGTPEDIVGVEKSHTGHYLAKLLKKSKKKK